ncbi:velvet factor-domain-containing protein [Cladochytrium replicatum]|nr:velvet factor-domain-containing protein [Cladochytrium replicatum]
MAHSLAREPTETSGYQFVALQHSYHERPQRNYRLSLLQQPKQSRMCGFGEKVDRRPVDPPPIIQLEFTDAQSSFTPAPGLESSYYFLYASLIAPDSVDELHFLRDGKTRSTTGSMVSSLYRLKGIDGKEGAFFVFPDLGVRMEGIYRLKFSLYEIVNSEIYFCISIISDIFNVYAAKKFPGMEESTQLSRTFAEQGLKIRIRKETRNRKGKDSGVQERTTYGDVADGSSGDRDKVSRPLTPDDDDENGVEDRPTKSRRLSNGTRSAGGAASKSTHSTTPDHLPDCTPSTLPTPDSHNRA